MVKVEDIQNYGKEHLESVAASASNLQSGVQAIATAYGDQATVNTMQTLRTVVHALRGWPTPLGATIRVGPDMFAHDGERLDERSRWQLELVAKQVVDGARSLASLGGD